MLTSQPMHHEAERLARPGVVAIDELLGVSFPVLDDGFVRIVDYMGNDGSIVQAARVSYGSGTKQVHEDRGLIRYLMRHRHSTPFEMCELKLHVRVPMDCWRQWIRHRTASVNEYSTRYSVAIDATQRTDASEWRLQSTGNRQGSDGMLDRAAGELLSAAETSLQTRAREVYQQRLALGIAREQARKDLPLCSYTEAYWKVDLHNLLHFLALRMDAHAQYEIRQYARLIGEKIVARWVPYTWEAFTDYRLGGEALTRIDREVIRTLASEGAEAACLRAQELGILEPSKRGGFKRNRERDELGDKLRALGMVIPWEAAEERVAGGCD